MISEIYKPPSLEDISWNVLVYEEWQFWESKISDQSAKCKGEVEVIVFFNYRGERERERERFHCWMQSLTQARLEETDGNHQ